MEQKRLSKTEVEVIDCLQRSIPQKDIAEHLRKDSSTISKRIKALKRAGIIQYPVAIVDPTKLAIYIVCGLIKLKLPREHWHWSEVATTISKISPKIKEIVLLSGSEWDIFIKCYVNSLDEYYDDLAKRILDAIDIHAISSFILSHPAKYDSSIPRECLETKE